MSWVVMMKTGQTYDCSERFEDQREAIDLAMKLLRKYDGCMV